MTHQNNPQPPKRDGHQKSGRNPAWRASGEEPDYRFTLANERTFLAWIRTALALLAAGLLLDQFSTKLEPHVLVVATALVMILAAVIVSVFAYTKWRANEIAMRHKGALPHSHALAVLVGTLSVACMGLAVLTAVSALGG